MGILGFGILGMAAGSLQQGKYAKKQYKLAKKEYAEQKQREAIEANRLWWEQHKAKKAERRARIAAGEIKPIITKKRVIIASVVLVVLIVAL